MVTIVTSDTLDSTRSTLPTVPIGRSARPGTRTERQPAAVPRLHVSAWDDPVLDRVGLDPRGTYAELFWLPVCGPSALWLLRRMNDGLDTRPDGYMLDPRELAAALGIGGPGSRHDPLDRALRRLQRFGLVRCQEPAAVAVRRTVAPIPRHRLERLPASLQARHASWESAAPEADRQRRRARAVASDMATLGDGAATIERRLLGAGMHPAVAYEAATWAATAWADLLAG